MCRVRRKEERRENRRFKEKRGWVPQPGEPNASMTMAAGGEIHMRLRSSNSGRSSVFGGLLIKLPGGMVKFLVGRGDTEWCLFMDGDTDWRSAF